MKPFPIISRHAIDRYRERVDPSARPRDAAARISRILDSATARPRPRHWMRIAATAPGTSYLYSAAYPNVGLVVANGVVVTLHSRLTCKSWSRRWTGLDGRRSRRAQPYRRQHWTAESEAA
jgi:hypothetical protein